MGDLPTHYAIADLEWVPMGTTGWHRATVTLTAADTADKPAGAKELVYGPCIVTYERAPDQAVTALVERQD